MASIVTVVGSFGDAQSRVTPEDHILKGDAGSLLVRFDPPNEINLTEVLALMERFSMEDAKLLRPDLTEVLSVDGDVVSLS